MKRTIALFSLLSTLILPFQSYGQMEGIPEQCGTRIIKGDFDLLIHGFSGDFVYLFGTGVSYEQTMTERWSMDFGITYNVRIDDRINPPQSYTDVVYFALGFRNYPGQAPAGFYWGPGLSLALPTSQTTAGDFFISSGYQLIAGHLAVDLNLCLGYGASRDRIDDYWGSYYETWWGVLIKPKVSFGFAF